MQLPLLCEKTGALAIVEPGLMAGRQSVVLHCQTTFFFYIGTGDVVYKRKKAIWQCETRQAIRQTYLL